MDPSTEFQGLFRRIMALINCTRIASLRGKSIMEILSTTLICVELLQTLVFAGHFCYTAHAFYAVKKGS